MECKIRSKYPKGTLVLIKHVYERVTYPKGISYNIMESLYISPAIVEEHYVGVVLDDKRVKITSKLSNYYLWNKRRIYNLEHVIQTGATIVPHGKHLMDKFSIEKKINYIEYAKLKLLYFITVK